MSEDSAEQAEERATPYEFGVYRETAAGGYSSRDCTVAFYTRIDALLDKSFVVLNVGAGRGANITRDFSSYRRKVQTFKGRATRVIGIDVDDAVKENPDLDEAHVFKIGDRYPIEDASVDLIVCDHVLEHVADPEHFAKEVKRVLKPGGWFCGRTPTKWGYIGLGARAVPNAMHTRLLAGLQPQRKAEDVFPTVYRLNTFRALDRHFTHDDWLNCTYGYNGVPSYHGNRLLLFRLVELWCWLMPKPLSAKLHVFLQKL